ncbi:hypothetical protein PGT21_015129 [Puccinia graminis f. sp. tritici]|uniref:Uncharacterized protein n=1 Tax=Puccinia graminis f. sp. tritici TaxID=56615 RepID=A0A5B0LIX4_PUCGR|nr:hypothetical protein PGT21_015129 [Puccinia graminis f. sp. tritici]
MLSGALINMPYQRSSNHLRRIPEDSSARLSLIVCGRDAGVFCATVEEKGDRATTDSPDQASSAHSWSFRRACKLQGSQPSTTSPAKLICHNRQLRLHGCPLSSYPPIFTRWLHP